MGFFLGFFAGIGAGVAFGQWGLNFPLSYQPKPNGFGKVEVNLQVLDPVYQRVLAVSDYFSSARTKVYQSNQPLPSSESIEVPANLETSSTTTQ